MKALRLGALGALSLVMLGATGSLTAQADTQTISWLVPEDPLIDSYAKQVAKAFEKNNPGVTVNVITPGSTAYDQKLLTLTAAGQTPDVFTDWGNTGVYTIINHHMAANLNPLFASHKVNPDYIPATYRKEFSENGNLYGIPWLSNPEFIAYNKTLFDKYHVPLPTTSWNNKSWTLNKLLSDAKLLTHDTSNLQTASWGANIMPGSIGSLAWLWNADPLNPKGGPNDTPAYTGGPLPQTYATRPGIVTAMQWVADLTNKYHVTPDPGTLNALSSKGNAFFSGKIAIAEVAGWLWRQAAVANPKFQWGIVPIPYGPGGSDTAQREDNAFYLSATSAHPDTAFKLMVFATTGWGAHRLVDVAKVNPPNTDAAYFTSWLVGISEIPGFSMDSKTFRSVFQGGITHDFPDPGNVLNGSAALQNPFTQLMSPVWLGKETAAEGLKNVQDAWRKALQ